MSNLARVMEDGEEAAGVAESIDATTEAAPSNQEHDVEVRQEVMDVPETAAEESVEAVADVVAAEEVAAVIPAASPKGRKDRLKKRSKECIASVFHETFIVDCVEIDKKEILRYIRGTAEPILGTDYYYGYVYEDGHLSFIATQSSRYVDGELSVFTPAFLTPDSFYYRHGSLFRLLETTEKGTTEQVVYELPEDAIALHDNQVLDRKTIPPTLFLRWSQKKARLSVAVLVSVAFVLSAIICAGMSMRYEQVVKEIQRKPVAAPQEKALKMSTDFGLLLKKMAAQIEGKGTINAMRAHGPLLSFAIAFPKESDARDFMAMVGPAAVYDNGVVTVGLKIGASGPGQDEAPQTPPAPAQQAAPAASATQTPGGAK